MKELLDAVNKLRAQIKREHDALLIVDGCVIFCSPDGSMTDEEAVELGFERISMDVEMWRENARTLTAKGRAELDAEHEAFLRILSASNQAGFDTSLVGDGCGRGNVKCFDLNLRKEATV